MSSDKKLFIANFNLKIMETETYYIKKGRRYIPFHRLDINGVGEGLWLVVKNKNSKSFTNLLYTVKTHDLQNVGKFADFYKAHKEEIQKMVSQEYENFFKKKREANEGFSISELTDCIIAGLSKIE